MEMAQTIRDKEITEQNKSFLQQVNGNIVWGKTNQDPINVLISSKVFQEDTFTWQGTVHHEYTHAHDFWELADYLKLTEMDDIYDYQYYHPFEWWSEYHARKAGAMNVYQNEYIAPRVDKERNAILVKGAVPGPVKGIVTLRNSVKA